MSAWGDWNEEEAAQPTIKVSAELLRRVLYEYYTVTNPSKIENTPAAQANFESLVSFYHQDIMALQERLLGQYDRQMDWAALGLNADGTPRHGNESSLFSASAQQHSTRSNTALAPRHPLEPPS